MVISTDKILWAQMHIWTLKKYANPKTEKFWVGVRNWLVVINPESIAEQLEVTRQKIQELKKEKKDILIICEKWLYRKELEILAQQAWIHYLNYKVPWGVLTNFDTLLSRVKSMNELREFMESDEYDRLTKKEKLIKKRQHDKLEIVYKWVKNLRKIPDLVVVIDWMYMSKFVDEAKRVKTDSIIFASTNFDRWVNEDSLVVMNMNSYDALDFALNYILK